MSEDYGMIWLRVSDHSLNEARHDAAKFAEEIGDPWSRTRYLGKQRVRLCDHADWEGCALCPKVEAWAFEVYEGTYRG